MAKKIIKARLKQRTDTQANWAANNPVLLEGELGLVTDDKNLYKVGDGVTAWNDLPFRGFDGTLVHETGDSDNAAMSQRGVTRALDKLKESTVEKVPGKGLSTEDYTTEEKMKLAGLQNFNDTEIKGKLAALSAEKEDKANKTTALSSASTDTQYPSARATFVAISKKSEVSLEALANGNLKVTIDGVSKDFMAATPSGDPNHYTYEEYGCVWNGGEDKIVGTPWAAYADDEEDKVVTHKSGCWLLHGIGDLTTAEVRRICARGLWNSEDRYPLGYAKGLNNARTLLYRAGEQNALFAQIISGYNGGLLSINLSNMVAPNEVESHQLSVTQSFFISSVRLKYIFGGHLVNNSAQPNAFQKCEALRICRIRTKADLYIGDSPYFNNYCIRYVIENNTATKNITITLHADAYARAMADAEITAALAAHPNVSLAKA